MFKILHIPTGCFLYKRFGCIYIGHQYIIGEYLDFEIFTVNNKNELLQLFKSSKFIKEIQIDLRSLNYPTVGITIADFELCEINNIKGNNQCITYA